jgi:Domain of unknown function (DUF4838)/Glycosyl hydrolase family 67 N-terminus
MQIQIGLGLAVAILATGSAGALTLTTDGESNYVIVLAEDAIPPERTAASELQEHLAAVTGCTLQIVDAQSVPDDSRQIVLGPSAQFQTAFPDVTLESLRRDGIVMKTTGDTLYLAGDRPRGTLYAVYTFLEDLVGCRWWSATERFVPEKPTLTIPELDTVYVPKLLCREAFYRGAFDGVYAARSKCNGHFERISPEYGGHYTILGWCHTFYQLLPPETYFEKHPEWYSQVEGKRVADHTQLCLTNAAMRAEFVKKALEWCREDPDSGIISISQNDWHGQCQCAKCVAIEKKEGAASGPLIHFVNAVAAEIEKEFPDMLIETLAYQYTRQAPKHVKPRQNVIIRLCTIECSFAQPLATGEQNAAFKKDMEDWSAISPQLFVWDYVTNFSNYILPHPNMRVLAPNIRFFVENKAVGLFEQGDSSCSISDFPELRAWLLAHLMWDPSRDEKALSAEFLNAYYGPAAEPLQQYIDLIHDAVETTGAYLRCFMPDTSEWLSLDGITRATELFDEAERLVSGDEVLSTRVRRARMPLDHVWLNRYYGLKRAAKAENREFPGPKDSLAFAEEFIRTARGFDAGSFRESHAFSEYEERLRLRFRPPGPPPARCKGMDPDEYVDIQDNAFEFYRWGDWSSIVDDADASDGKAARMPATHHQWAVQHPVSGDIGALGPVHCYIAVRCDAKAESGAALDCGIYDTKARKDVARGAATIEASKDGYVDIDLGVHQLSADMYFWVAPKNNPEEVAAVFVDRFYVVKEK